MFWPRARAKLGVMQGLHLGSLGAGATRLTPFFLAGLLLAACGPLDTRSEGNGSAGAGSGASSSTGSGGSAGTTGSVGGAPRPAAAARARLVLARALRERAQVEPAV